MFAASRAAAWVPIKGIACVVGADAAILSPTALAGARRRHRQEPIIAVTGTPRDRWYRECLVRHRLGGEPVFLEAPAAEAALASGLAYRLGAFGAHFGVGVGGGRMLGRCVGRLIVTR